jgi:hypothetical protein
MNFWSREILCANDLGGKICTFDPSDVFDLAKKYALLVLAKKYAFLILAKKYALFISVIKYALSVMLKISTFDLV